MNRLPPREEERRLRAYESTVSDADAAARLGMHVKAFRTWRRTRRLPTHEPPGWPWYLRPPWAKTVSHAYHTEAGGLPKRGQRAACGAMWRGASKSPPRPGAPRGGHCEDCLRAIQEDKPRADAAPRSMGGPGAWVKDTCSRCGCAMARRWCQWPHDRAPRPLCPDCILTLSQLRAIGGQDK